MINTKILKNYEKLNQFDRNLSFLKQARQRYAIRASLINQFNNLRTKAFIKNSVPILSRWKKKHRIFFSKTKFHYEISKKLKDFNLKGINHFKNKTFLQQFQKPSLIFLSPLKNYNEYIFGKKKLDYMSMCANAWRDFRLFKDQKDRYLNTLTSRKIKNKFLEQLHLRNIKKQEFNKQWLSSIIISSKLKKKLNFFNNKKWSKNKSFRRYCRRKLKSLKFMFFNKFFLKSKLKKKIWLSKRLFVKKIMKNYKPIFYKPKKMVSITRGAKNKKLYNKNYSIIKYFSFYKKWMQNKKFNFNKYNYITKHPRETKSVLEKKIYLYNTTSLLLNSLKRHPLSLLFRNKPKKITEKNFVYYNATRWWEKRNVNDYIRLLNWRGAHEHNWVTSKISKPYYGKNNLLIKKYRKQLANKKFDRKKLLWGFKKKKKLKVKEKDKFFLKNRILKANYLHIPKKIKASNQERWFSYFHKFFKKEKYVHFIYNLQQAEKRGTISANKYNHIQHSFFNTVWGGKSIRKPWIKKKKTWIKKKKIAGKKILVTNNKWRKSIKKVKKNIHLVAKIMRRKKLFKKEYYGSKIRKLNNKNRHSHYKNKNSIYFLKKVWPIKHLRLVTRKKNKNKTKEIIKKILLEKTKKKNRKISNKRFINWKRTTISLRDKIIQKRRNFLILKIKTKIRIRKKNKIVRRLSKNKKKERISFFLMKAFYKKIKKKKNRIKNTKKITLLKNKKSNFPKKNQFSNKKDYLINKKKNKRNFSTRIIQNSKIIFFWEKLLNVVNESSKENKQKFLEKNIIMSKNFLNKLIPKRKKRKKKKLLTRQNKKAKIRLKKNCIKISITALPNNMFVFINLINNKDQKTTIFSSSTGQLGFKNSRKRLFTTMWLLGKSVGKCLRRLKNYAYIPKKIILKNTTFKNSKVRGVLRGLKDYAITINSYFCTLKFPYNGCKKRAMARTGRKQIFYFK
jgi:hypothetical protein